MKVYIDSPMATSATEVFSRHANVFDQQTRDLIANGQDPLALPVLEFTRTTEESMALNKIRGGAVIISASGMCEAGRIKHHLRHNLWRPECTVLLVGYQVPGTKGYLLKEGAGMIRIHGEEVAVRAEIRSMEGFSAHADQQALLDWVGNFKTLPGRIFLVHGEAKSSAALAEALASKYGVLATVPALGESVQLTPGEVIGEEKLWKTYAAVTAELEELLKAKAAQDQYPGILQRLEDLGGLLESIKKAAAKKAG